MLYKSYHKQNIMEHECTNTLLLSITIFVVILLTLQPFLRVHGELHSLLWHVEYLLLQHGAALAGTYGIIITTYTSCSYYMYITNNYA